MNVGTSKTGAGDTVSTVSLLGCSTSVALAAGPNDEEEEEEPSCCSCHKPLNAFGCSESCLHDALKMGCLSPHHCGPSHCL